MGYFLHEIASEDIENTRGWLVMTIVEKDVVEGWDLFVEASVYDGPWEPVKTPEFKGEFTSVSDAREWARTVAVAYLFKKE